MLDWMSLSLCTDRLPNVYIMKVPWFREDSVTTSRQDLTTCPSICLSVQSYDIWLFLNLMYLPVTQWKTVIYFVYPCISLSIPSVTEISGMLHTSRPDNSAGVLLQLHTAPNCHYKVLPTEWNGIVLFFLLSQLGIAHLMWGIKPWYRLQAESRLVFN